jgi:S1-C subfamily serine protease
VAITSDGWVSTSDVAISGLRISDLAVAVGGRVRPVERGIRDRSTGIAYLKIATGGLPTPAFVRASDVVSGAAVWVEAQPRQLHPEIILTVRAPSQEPTDSMVIGRRFLISMPTGITRPIGASVWDGAGRLVGLVEKMDGAGQAQVIPATTLGSSLSQWLANGSIQRASLGVRTLDMSGITLDMATSSLPTLGAWVRNVSASGPAYRQLLVGDVIERIERDILDGTADLGERLLDYRPGVSVTLTGRRRGAAFSVLVPLADETVSETIK